MNPISPRAKSSCDIEVNLVRSKNRVAIAAVMQPKSKLDTESATHDDC